MAVSRTASVVATIPMAARGGKARPINLNLSHPRIGREMRSPRPPLPHPPRLALLPPHPMAIPTNRLYRASRHILTTLLIHSRRIIMVHLGTQLHIRPRMSAHFFLVRLQARRTPSKVHPRRNLTGIQATLMHPPRTPSNRVSFPLIHRVSIRITRRHRIHLMVDIRERGKDTVITHHKDRRHRPVRVPPRLPRSRSFQRNPRTRRPNRVAAPTPLHNTRFPPNARHRMYSFVLPASHLFGSQCVLWFPATFLFL